MPECLKKWKLQQDEMLQKKDANEELRKEELQAKTAQEFADWHKQYEEQLEKKDRAEQVSTELVEGQVKEEAAELRPHVRIPE